MSEATAETKPTSIVASFSGFMDKLKPQMALALPKHMTADRMTRLALTAFSTNAKLQACEPKTIAASIMVAAQLGLEPGVNGAGYLIPYGRTCTFVPGWKGLVDLVARSGRGTVFTGVIFKDQKYTFVDGARRDLVIHNETDCDAPEDITHAFAIGWVKDATMPIIELWRVSKIRKHRDKYNKVGQQHYSFRDWEMYCRKVPLLQVLKYMPCSIEVSNAIAVSNAAEQGRTIDMEGGIILDDDLGPEAPEGGQATGTKTEVLKDRLRKKGAPAKGSEPEEKPEGNPPVTYAQAEHAINAATELDTLDLAGDLISGVADAGQREELAKLYRDKRAVMADEPAM